MFSKHGALAAGAVVTALTFKVSTILNDWRRFHKRRVLVSRDTFNKMDRDGSGKVRRHEFLRYMLVRQGLVKAEALENIDALFEDLDQDKSGILSFDEINGRLLPLDS